MHVKFTIMSEHWQPGKNYEVECNRRDQMKAVVYHKVPKRHIFIGGAIQRNPNFKPLLHNGGK